MTRNEVLEKLSQGFKVRHNYFSENEFIEMKAGKILTEDGYDFTSQFWANDYFLDGWEIV